MIDGTYFENQVCFIVYSSENGERKVKLGILLLTQHLDYPQLFCLFQANYSLVCKYYYSDYFICI